MNEWCINMLMLNLKTKANFSLMHEPETEFNQTSNEFQNILIFNSVRFGHFISVF